MRSQAIPTAIAPTTAALSPERLVEAFEGRITRVWTSPLYLTGLFVVAVVMVLLPLIYVGLTGLLAYALYCHITEDAPFLRGGYGVRWRAVVYAAPIIVGAILLFFMVKPLFARRARGEQRISLVPDNDAVLFDFVERLCSTLGAPRPRRIDVDCLVNASAGFRRGLLSLFWPADLVLTIGAPLVAGMTLRQFAGVLAHEFGHFTQGVGMRLSYVIRRVNAWFARVVYERDAWDQWLIEMSADDDRRWAVVFLIARLFIWLTRKILWALMMFGHVISSAFMRQMEYNADRYEFALAGSDHFQSTVLRIIQLNLASRAVHADLAESWKDGRLADNFPLLVAHKVEVIPDKLLDQVRSDAEKNKTGLWDTHPADVARIGRARKHDQPGVFHVQAPASMLFRDFEGLCKTVTLFYYQDLIGPRFDPAQLISTEALARRARQKTEDQAAVARYFLGCVSPLRPLSIDRFSPVSQLPAKECLARLKRARSAVENAAAVMRTCYEKHHRTEVALARAHLAHTLLTARVKIDPKEFKLSAASPEQAFQARNRAEQAIQDSVSELVKVEAVLRLRLECALALLRFPIVASRIAESEAKRRRCEKLLDALSTLHTVSGDLLELRRNQDSLRTLNNRFDPTKRDENFMDVTQKALLTQHQRLTDIRRALSEANYPYEHAKGSISMAQYTLPSIPARDELTGTALAGERVLDHLDSLYLRLMGELAMIAEQVEAAVGLAPGKENIDPDSTKQAKP